MLRKDSCIVANLSRYFSLDDNERDLLLRLERNPQEVTGKKTLWPIHSKMETLYTIKSGWACTFRDNLDGERQVVDVLVPGDVIGLRDLTFKTHLSEARMITQGIICPFPHQEIVDIFQASTPLTIALLASVARQESILTERMLTMVHRSARSRIAHFFLETYTRLNRVRPTDLDDFYLPISQQMLGEVLGVTSVHINRSLMAMEKDHVLKKHRNHIEVIDKDRLFDEADFDGEYMSDEMDGLREYLKLARA